MSVVDRVECIHLRFEMPPEATFSTPGGPVHGRLTTIIRLTTDDGHTGIGSAYAHPAVVQAVVDHLTPFVVGYDPRATERLGQCRTVGQRAEISTRTGTQTVAELIDGPQVDVEQLRRLSRGYVLIARGDSVRLWAGAAGDTRHNHRFPVLFCGSKRGWTHLHRSSAD